MVVLRTGHWLHDGVIGSCNGLCPRNRAAAKSLVRPTLCDTAPRYDFRQLHDRHFIRSRHLDDEPRQPACRVEAQLMLGATRREAVAPVTRQALRSALMPTIN